MTYDKRLPTTPAAFLVVFDDDARKLQAHIIRLLGHLNRDLARDLTVQLGDRTGRVGHHAGSASVGLFSNTERQWQGPKEINPEVGSHLLATAMTKNRLGMPAITANMYAHILNDTKDRNTDLLEHFQTLARVE